MRLLNCGAHEEALAELLKFPQALGELWYDANQGEWEGRYAGEPALEFTCEAVRRCVATHAESLEKMVFTRPPLVHEGLGYGDAIDLEDFERLRSLSVHQVFLVNLISNTRVSRCLPPNLEELEVFYDDSGYVDFLDQGDIAHPHWLLTLLEELKGPDSKLKALSRIRIVALEWAPGQDEVDADDGQDSSNASSSTGHDSRGSGDVQLRGHPNSPWRPPEMLLDLLVQAGICFSIFLHPKRRARLTPDHVKGFDDDWEDEWDSEVDFLPSFV
ncbi:RNI-like protein [Apiospora phragmitis]|uniref:RNI-like protein n=1 Tax=Apiospora phragmitis TaxID=2905665 RepID=A0ABR1T869_9PEZI